MRQPKLNRTRFAGDIVAEYLAPKRASKKVVIVCDGMPSLPSKQELVRFFSRQNYWVFYPRYRGSWESGGRFLKISPHQDLLDIFSQLPKGFTDAKTGKILKVKPQQIFLAGGSFAGPAIILASRDKRVTKGVVCCPVVDWKAPSRDEPLGSFEKYVRNAYGDSYRFQSKDWNKLKSGKFYNPAAVADTVNGNKLLLVHAKNDPVVSYSSVKKFAITTGAKLITLPTGGHISSNTLMKPRFAKIVKQFFQN